MRQLPDSYTCMSEMAKVAAKNSLIRKGDDKNAKAIPHTYPVIITTEREPIIQGNADLKDLLSPVWMSDLFNDEKKAKKVIHSYIDYLFTKQSNKLSFAQYVWKAFKEYYGQLD